MKLKKITGFITREEIEKWIQLHLSPIAPGSVSESKVSPLDHAIEFKIPFDQSKHSDGFTGVEFEAMLVSTAVKPTKQRKSNAQAR